MERLLSDASELTGKEYNLDNLNDVYEAIHVIQTELDITGTTSKEASETLSGSFASMKSAFTNFMGALVTGDGLSQAMSGLIDSASTFFFGNLVPALQEILGQLPDVLGAIWTEGLPKLASKLLATIPSLLTTVAEMLNSLATNITESINKFAEGGKMSSGAKKAISSFAKGLVNAIPLVVSAIGKLILALLSAVAKLPGRLLKAGVNAIKSFISGLKSIRLPKLKITWSKDSKEGDDGSIISIPKPHLEWYAKGGIFSSPSVIGVGEKGSEAVLPLDRFWKELKNAGGNTVNFNGNYSFRNRDDIEYFMKQSEKLTRRAVAL